MLYTNIMPRERTGSSEQSVFGGSVDVDYKGYLSWVDLVEGYCGGGLIRGRTNGEYARVVKIKIGSVTVLEIPFDGKGFTSFSIRWYSVVEDVNGSTDVAIRFGYDLITSDSQATTFEQEEPVTLDLTESHGSLYLDDFDVTVTNGQSECSMTVDKLVIT